MSNMLNQRGQSLVQLMVGVALMGTISIGMLTMIDGQNKNVKVIAQKQELLDLKNLIIHNLNKNAVCSWQLLNKPVDTSGTPTQTTPSPTVVSLDGNTLYAGLNNTSQVIAKAGELLPSTQTGIRVQAVSFKNIFATGNPNEYQGTLEITYNQNSMMVPLKPIQQPLVIRTAGPPSSSDTILSCYGADSTSRLGNYQPKVQNTDYVADTDGFVVATAWASDTSRDTYIIGSVDGVDVAWAGTHDFVVENSPGPQTLNMPVQRGKSWRIRQTHGVPANVRVNWVPIGAP